MTRMAAGVAQVGMPLLLGRRLRSSSKGMVAGTRNREDTRSREGIRSRGIRSSKGTPCSSSQCMEEAILSSSSR